VESGGVRGAALRSYVMLPLCSEWFIFRVSGKPRIISCYIQIKPISSYTVSFLLRLARSYLLSSDTSFYVV
jgi:hypothetical protein